MVKRNLNNELKNEGVLITMTYEETNLSNKII